MHEGGRHGRREPGDTDATCQQLRAGPRSGMAAFPPSIRATLLLGVAASLAAGAPSGPVLQTAQLTVTMDGQLPRPLAVLYPPPGGGAAVTFTASVGGGADPAVGDAVSASLGSTVAALATPCSSLKPPFCNCTGGAGNVRNCSCALSGKCGSINCQICDSPAPPGPPPVPPGPPPPPRPPPPPPSNLPRSAACIGVIAANGSVTQFCADTAGEIATVYTTANATSAAWHTTLTKASGVTASLSGSVSIAGLTG